VERETAVRKPDEKQKQKCNNSTKSDNIYEAILTVLKRIIVIAAIVCAVIMIALVVHFLL